MTKEDMDLKLLEAIDKLTISQRAEALRHQFFDEKPGVSGRRAMLTVESWKETEGEPLVIRRAKLFKKVVEGDDVTIFPGQILVGSDTKYFRGSNTHEDLDGNYLSSLLEEEKGTITLGGPKERALLEEEDFQILVEAVKFWKGKTQAEKVRQVTKAIFGSWHDDYVEAGVQRYESFTDGPSCPLYETVLKEGLRGMIERMEGYIQCWCDSREHDIDRLHFWQAGIITCEAAINFAKRYAQQAMTLAAVEKDADLRAALETIARVCEWVPENPARTFHEALQSVILIHLLVKKEVPCVTPGAYGSIDQYLYPYFRKDLDEGRLDLERAIDLVTDFLLYGARLEWVAEVSWRDYLQRGQLTNVSLGGPDKNGEDISNELTYLILHAVGLVRMAEPHICLRWHKDTPKWLMDKALETSLRAKGGIPQFQNSDAIVAYMVNRGVPLGNAREWISSGCSVPHPSDQGGAMFPSYFNIPLIVDMTLHNGVCSKTGKRLGLETGDPRTFKTFEELFEAFTKQADYTLRRHIWFDQMANKIRRENFRQPFGSVLMPGCLEKGADFACGGMSSYRITYKVDRGLVPAGDSLYAIKRLVYEEKKLTMAELIDALDRNFTDGNGRGEEIRQMLLAAPKYGNDIDEVDLMVHDVARLTGSIIQSVGNTFDGSPICINRNGQGWHYFAGKRLSALPNGRPDGEPLADGSASAMQGMDRKGPTALLSSALKADFGHDSAQAILTIKVPPMLFASSETRDKIITLIERFFHSGGTYIQFNVLDSAELRDAQLHSENYKDLLVRVGGYSAYFVSLSREIQDELIKRTEHSF